MKISTLLFGCLLAGVLWAPARTWTSSDGSKTFEGELQAYDKSTGELTVLVGGRQLVFNQSKLSEDDHAYLSEWKPEADRKAKMASEEKAMSEQVVGSKLTKRVLRRLDGKRFKRVEMDKKPEYYLLYFSASW